MAAASYYDILGVSSKASAKEIRKAYLNLSLTHHPDKNPAENRAEAQEKFVAIGQAYETLSNPQLRAEYDRNLRFGGVFSGASRNNSSSNGGSPSYESYRDVFDETVAGMSEAELSAVMGAASLIGSVIGSILAARATKQRSASGGTRSGSSLWATAGSLVGSAVASEFAASSIKALHQDSVERVAYKEQCRLATSRGQAMPAPPKQANWKSKIQEAVLASLLPHDSDSDSDDEEREQPNQKHRSSNKTERDANKTAFQKAVEQIRDQAMNAAANNPEFIARVMKQMAKSSSTARTAAH